jgi:hypothetical protein
MNISADNTTKDCYSTYNNNVVEAMQVPYSAYMEILKEFNSLLRSRIIYNSEDIKLPCNLGRLRVKKFKMKLHKMNKLKPDWKATKELWARNPECKAKKQLVLHLNEHRSGYAYRVYWDKNISRVKNHRYYHFKPSRQFSRELSKVLKDRPDIDYYL